MPFNLVAIVGLEEGVYEAIGAAYAAAPNVAVLSNKPPCPLIKKQYPDVFYGLLPGWLYNPLATTQAIRVEIEAIRDWFELDPEEATCLLMHPVMAKEYQTLFPDFKIEALEDTRAPHLPKVKALAVPIHCTGFVLLGERGGMIGLPEFGVGDTLRVKESCDVAVVATGIKTEVTGIDAPPEVVRGLVNMQLKSWRGSFEIFDHPSRVAGCREIAFAQSYLIDTEEPPPVGENYFWWPLAQLGDIESRIIGDQAEIIHRMASNLR